MGEQLSRGKPLSTTTADSGAGWPGAAIRRPAGGGWARWLRAGLWLMLDNFAAVGVAYIGVLPASIDTRALRRRPGGRADHRPSRAPLSRDEQGWQAELER
jgi:hypothetical protein